MWISCQENSRGMEKEKLKCENKNIILVLINMVNMFLGVVNTSINVLFVIRIMHILRVMLPPKFCPNSLAKDIDK